MADKRIVPGLWGSVFGLVDEMLYKPTRQGVQRAIGWRFTTGDRVGFEKIGDSALQALQLHYKNPMLEALAGFFIAHIQAGFDVIERHLAVQNARIALLEMASTGSDTGGRPTKEFQARKKALEAIIARGKATEGECVPVMHTPLAFMRFGELPPQEGESAPKVATKDEGEAPAAAAG